MTPGRAGSRRFDSLATRLAALLTLAILPLGLIAIIQTNRLIEESAAKTDAALFGEMQRAARGEREAIQSMVGLARGLANGAADLSDPVCSRLMTDIVESSGEMVFAGFIRPDGTLSCGNRGVGRDLSGVEGFDEAMERPRVIIQVPESGAISAEPVINIGAPAYADGVFAGYLSLSMPHDAIATRDRAGALRPLDLVTFNAEGVVLTSSLAADEGRALLPANRALQTLAGPVTVFREVSVDGSVLVYTITPLIDDVVYAMAIWSPDVVSETLVQSALLTVFLPIAMWITSLGVAYFAVHRLVIRNIDQLRRRMRLFSRFRRVEEEPNEKALPTELREVSESFAEMAHTIIRDEAELENSLHEKDVLLREVYHRVRNNLQLIASINNMQIRASTMPETRAALGRLQDRIMALATIHHSLYEADSLSRMRADRLVADLALQVVQKGSRGQTRVELDTDLEPVTLYPDQAVPLSLLLVEAMSNALKAFEAAPDGAEPRLRVSLLRQTPDTIELVIENTCSGEASATATATQGLGSRLIEAFVIQLDGQKEISNADGVYRLLVRFKPVEFSPDHRPDPSPENPAEDPAAAQ